MGLRVLPRWEPHGANTQGELWDSEHRSGPANSVHQGVYRRRGHRESRQRVPRKDLGCPFGKLSSGGCPLHPPSLDDPMAPPQVARGSTGSRRRGRHDRLSVPLSPWAPCWLSSPLSCTSMENSVTHRYPVPTEEPDRTEQRRSPGPEPPWGSPSPLPCS